jgi:MFS family permease
MSLNVKEGEYPPPPEYVDGKQGLLSGIKTYFTECFIHKFYWFFFLGTAAAELSASTYPFIMLMQRKALGLSTGQIGMIAGTAAIVVAVLLIPAGIMSDKHHPLRTTLWATGALALLYPLRFVYLFRPFTPHEAFIFEYALSVILIPASAMYAAASLPMYMRLLPSERYGQFCSAQAMVRSLLMILAGLAVGGSLDLLNGICTRHGMPLNFYFKFAPVIMWVFWLTSFILLIPLYRMWKQFGGDESYQPPAVGVDTQGNMPDLSDNTVSATD